MESGSITKSRRRIILWCAGATWLLFAVSFVLPVTKDHDIMGWQAFWIYVAQIWDLPNYWQSVRNNPIALLASTFPSTNGATFVAPIILWRWPRWSLWLGGALAAGGLVPLIGFFDMILGNELRSGFYCWVGSIFSMSALCFICGREVRKSRRRLTQPDGSI